MEKDESEDELDADDVEPLTAHDDDDDTEPPVIIATWINRYQWIAVVVMLTGIVLLFAVGRREGFATIGGALALAGLFPVITGTYRSPFGRLLGWKARLRGLFSVALGGTVMMIGLSLPPS